MIKSIFKIGLSIGVSFAILALLLQMFTTGLPEGERPAILSVLQATSFHFVLGYIALYFVSLLVRSYRYRLLISLAGEENVPSVRQMIIVTGIRNMVVDMLPARLGELGYVGLLNRGYGVKLQHCVSSLSISIALDFIALFVVVVFVVGKQTLGEGITGWAIGALVMAAILSLVAVLGLFLVTPWFTKLIVSRRPELLAQANFRAKLLNLLRDFDRSLQSVFASGKAGLVIAVSVLIRILKYSGFYLLFRAVVAKSFPELAELPVEHVISALIGGEIGSSLPIPAFMSFGVYEAGSALVFKLLGVGNQAATFITMLCVHIWSQSIEYLIGGAFIVTFVILNRQSERYTRSLAIPLSESSTDMANTRSKSNSQKAITFVVASSVLMAGGVFLAYQLLAATKLGALSAPSAGGIADNAADWKLLSQEHVSGLDGFIVFSSNRDGNHDIFRRDLKTFTLEKLTDHPYTETYPRISPNGERLVFSRAHQAWVSQRNTIAWDVYVLDLKTMQETKVGSNGTAPHWLNNSEITYLRDANVVERIDVDSGISSVVYQSGINNEMPLGSRLQNPKYNDKTKQLVFTARQNAIGTNTGHWGTAIDTSGSHRGVLNGCELAWSSDGRRLYQVNPGSPDGSLHIVSVDPDTLEHQTLINLTGEFTHEYWPKDSSNGQYMVFGASRGKHHHEHDTQDYEIFLWKIGSDPSKATRMTFHTGNDNWPDVFIR